MDEFSNFERYFIDNGEQNGYTKKLKSGSKFRYSPTDEFIRACEKDWRFLITGPFEFDGNTFIHSSAPNIMHELRRSTFESVVNENNIGEIIKEVAPCTFVDKDNYDDDILDCFDDLARLVYASPKVIKYARNWIKDNATVPIEVSDSYAVEYAKRLIEKSKIPVVNALDEFITDEISEQIKKGDHTEENKAFMKELLDDEDSSLVMLSNAYANIDIALISKADENGIRKLLDVVPYNAFKRMYPQKYETPIGNKKLGDRFSLFIENLEVYQYVDIAELLTEINEPSLEHFYRE